MFSANRNPFVGTAVTLQGISWEAEDKKVVNPLKYTFSTPALLSPSTLRLERTITSQYTGSGSFTSPCLTINRRIEETKAINEDFGQTLAQLKQVQAKLI